MAPSALSKVFLCRSCHQQLLKPNSTIRNFTSTPQRRRTIPAFTPTPSPELDDLLSTFRKQVFTPSALSKSHRSIIYKPTRQSILTNDPGITVTLSNEEEVKLEPMNMHHRPEKAQSLHKLLNLMQESKDWNNLPAFLEGMTMAHEPISIKWLQKFVRKANDNGKTGIIVRCAEMVKKTRLNLAEPQITGELMHGFHSRAFAVGFKGEEMEKVIKQAEKVKLMMESEDHCAGKLNKWQSDMRRSPEVVGLLLELAAAKAVVENGGVDEGGKVLDYATKAVSVMSVNDDLSIPHNADSNITLSRWIPMWNGMRQALKVDTVKNSNINKELKQHFRDLYDVVTKTVKQVKEEANGRPRLSLIMFEELEDM